MISQPIEQTITKKRLRNSNVSSKPSAKKLKYYVSKPIDRVTSSQHEMPADETERSADGGSTSKLGLRESGLVTTSAMEISAPLNYKPNMARKFRGSENRSPKAVELMLKNAIEGRFRRAKMKIIEKKRNLEARQATAENLIKKRTVAALHIYTNKLMTTLNRDVVEWTEKFLKELSIVN